MVSEITAIAHITTKQDMSRWTRAHADAPGITWSVFAGEGGTMIIVEHAEDRCTLNRQNAADKGTDAKRTAAAEPAVSAGVHRASA